ncbi:MAG: hypothetical protein M1378_10190 [Bacteroidetes bacterium]|nr:hypothetical protein [Bacteroidota bacterium]
MKSRNGRTDPLYVLIGLSLATMISGCHDKPVGPGNYSDPTKFTWTVDTVSDPRNYQTLLTSIWGTSANNLYVCGYASNDVGMIYRYDGKSWTKISVSLLEGGPIEGSLDLSWILGFSSNDIWVVGGFVYVDQASLAFVDSALFLHWDGNAWQSYPPSYGGSINQVHGLAPNDIWAVGRSIYHYDGASWIEGDVPVPPQRMGFASIAEVAPHDVYAVGFIRDVSPPTDTGSYYLCHYDGSAWTITDSVVITSSYVSQVTFGEKLFALKGTLYSSFVSPIRVMRNGTWSDFLNVPDVLYLGGNDGNNLYAIGMKGTVYWYDGSVWTRLEIPGSSGITFNAIWTNGFETFIVGDDGRRSYVYRGK